MSLKQQSKFDDCHISAKFAFKLLGDIFKFKFSNLSNNCMTMCQKMGIMEGQKVCQKHKKIKVWWLPHPGQICLQTFGWYFLVPMSIS